MNTSSTRSYVPALQVEHLAVRRGSFSLSVPALTVKNGRVTCIAGANGSGKTTLLEAVTGLTRPNAGNIFIAGHRLDQDALQAKRLIGYVPDDDAWIVPELTAAEFFELISSVYLHGRRRTEAIAIRHLASQLLFTSFKQQLGALSHGNRKKVQLIAALIHEPTLLIVDELRNGLDPIVIARAESLLKDLTKRGMAVLAATHDLWWAERFSDTVIMLQEGHIALQSSTKQVVKESGSVEAKFLELYGSQA